MKVSDISKVMPILERQVESLGTPWLDKLSSREGNPFTILISCLLSLRTQDRITEQASLRLYKIAKTPSDMAKLSVKTIEKAIYPVGFYRVKAKRIKDISLVLFKEHDSEVPSNIDSLLKLKGVGRKTANLVLTLGYEKPGICVDTHVHRIFNRLDFVSTRTPRDTEFALRRKLPRPYWKRINGLLVAFGQNICKPISPFCSRCALNKYCSKVGVSKSR
ncbi:MAG TPA: endonuclease III [Thermodesulfovibrionales bacterium]|nr:endonuclease III [Thermodesulfovibrionales bacterium]